MRILIKTIIEFLCIFYLFNMCCLVGSKSAFKIISLENVNNWFQQLNDQYLLLNQLSASYAWDIAVNQEKHLFSEATKFRIIRFKWRNSRCTEAAKNFSNEDLSISQKRMLWRLCRGPKYTDYEDRELSMLLRKAKNVVTKTEVCLPKGFNVCHNYNRLWKFTFVRRANGIIEKLNMQSVEPEIPLNRLENILVNTKFNKIYDAKMYGRPKMCMPFKMALENSMAGNLSVIHCSNLDLPSKVIIRWASEGWQLAVSPEFGKLYSRAANIMNIGARNNGYDDIGQCWREELEIDHTESYLKNLWLSIKPSYQILHGVLRNALWKKYNGSDLLNQNGPLPAHLLGNIWSQGWSKFHKLLMPFHEVDIEENLRKTNWSSQDMIYRVEDFFTSMGINPMTNTFWENSRFGRRSTKCHSSAFNMYSYKGDDYRIITCNSKRNLKSFYEIVHQISYIQYYMHFQHLPALFQDASNPAMAEAIGDAIFLAMMTPQHLNRLGLLPDKFLAPSNEILQHFMQKVRLTHKNKEAKEPISSKDKIKQSDDARIWNEKKDEIVSMFQNKSIQSDIDKDVHSFITLNEAKNVSLNTFDLHHLLRMALIKIPQIPFVFLLDQWRWQYFRGEFGPGIRNANDYFSKLSVQEQGIHSPDWLSREGFFDATAIYHIADNKPYVKYFLSSILQAQILKGLCEKTIFGKFNMSHKLPMPLHRCDIYGSKRAGRLLKKVLSAGASVHWSEVLFILTGSREISAEPLLMFYEPLFTWLTGISIENDIPIGW